MPATVQGSEHSCTWCRGAAVLHSMICISGYFCQMHLLTPGFVPQGVPGSGRVMPLTIRQMVVQQVQLEAIRRREAVSTS